MEELVAGWTMPPRQLPLDYSPASLRLLDRIVAGLRSGGGGAADVAGALRGLGAYLYGTLSVAWSS